MTTEWNLSEKINLCSEVGCNANYFYQDDVKEFIKRLKETLREGVKRNDILPLDWAFDRIDEIAGYKLK